MFSIILISFRFNVESIDCDKFWISSFDSNTNDGFVAVDKSFDGGLDSDVAVDGLFDGVLKSDVVSDAYCEFAWIWWICC